jgi:osmotically-inducible protein OsmY
MKTTSLKPIFVSVAIALLLSAVGCTSLTGETAGQYVDDTTITASVKAKLVADKAANFTRVDVDTTNKVVSLNGVVESPDQKTRAEQLAMQVAGVHRVENHLQIQARN